MRQVYKAWELGEGESRIYNKESGQKMFVASEFLAEVF